VAHHHLQPNVTDESPRLPAKSLTANTNQRKALNSWNKFVLGEEYIKETTKRFPKTKE